MLRFAWIGLIAMGCRADDVDKSGTDSGSDTGSTIDTVTDTQTDTQTDTGTPADPADALLGAWVSTGDDVSTVFGLFNIVQIDANFADDGTYVVTSLDADGATVEYTGTYTVDVTTTPAGIQLEQATPSVATAVGIWQVESDVLTYEVVQTVPDFGFSPPTAASGFGTSAGPGLNPNDNVQVFRRP